MQSSVSFPICQISCGSDKLLIYSLPALTLLGIGSIGISGFSPWLKIALIVLAISYALMSFKRYQKHASDVLESNQQGALFLVSNDESLALEQVVWRDYGFLIELQASMQGRQLSKFWFSTRLEYAELRQLRLLMKAQSKNPINSLPSIITNPVL